MSEQAKIRLRKQRGISFFLYILFSLYPFFFISFFLYIIFSFWYVNNKTYSRFWI